MSSPAGLEISQRSDLRPEVLWPILAGCLLLACLGCFGFICWRVKRSKRLTVRSPDTVTSVVERAPQRNPGLFGAGVGEDGTLDLAQVKLNLNRSRQVGHLLTLPNASPVARPDPVGESDIRSARCSACVRVREANLTGTRMSRSSRSLNLPAWQWKRPSKGPPKILVVSP